MKVKILQYDSILDIDEKALVQYTKVVAKEVSRVLKRIMPDIGIIFVSKKKIQEMNAQYRHINSPTDVLSFESEEEGYLGDIVISLAMVKQYATDVHEDFLRELHRDILHGILHLVGYDHKEDLVQGKDEKMFVLQESILQKLS